MPKLSNVNVILWWVEARFGKTVPVNRVKDAHDHVVRPCESHHCHTEKRTKESIKWHSHLMALASHLSIFRYDKLHNICYDPFGICFFNFSYLRKQITSWPKYFFSHFSQFWAVEIFFININYSIFKLCHVPKLTNEMART